MNEPFQLPSTLEICEKVSFGPEAKALAAEYPQAPDFIAALRQEKMSVDAVQALARSMPKETAVEWASQSARMAGEQTGLSPDEQSALEATKTWISNPDAANTTAVASAAADLPPDSPAGCAANAALFAEGIKLPEEASLPALATGDDLAGHFAASAVLLSAAKMSPEGIPEIPDVPEAATLDEVTEALPTDELIAEGAEQVVDSPSLEIPAEQQAQAAEALEPFIEMGVKLAETLPGWA